jgi:hypothetical protein
MANTLEEYLAGAATAIAKSAVTSRMSRVRLEGSLPRFLGYPVRFTTYRRPGKATVLEVFIGSHRYTRVVAEQRARLILKAAHSLTHAALSDVGLRFIFSEGKKCPVAAGQTSDS